MSQEVADTVQGQCRAIAVCDAYRLAPWADALVSQDAAWWREKAPVFAGRRFCGHQWPGTECLPPTAEFESGSNSGLQGMRVARDVFGATRILLLGFDMRGTHYFGRHKPPLPNTSEGRFQAHIRQFQKWRGPEVINCTPGSALTQFPTANLADVL